MDVRIEPSKLFGTIKAIPSKSYAQRILTASALSDKPTEILLDYISDDVRSAINALISFGAEIKIETDKLIVTPAKKSNQINIDCGESGTVARLLLPIVTAICDSGTITGQGSLMNRPFETLCDVLEKHGCCFDTKKLPITFNNKIKPGNYEIRGDESSQYISGLLFALPLLDGDSKIILTTPLESSGYVDMTIETLKNFGIESKYNCEIMGRQIYKSPGKINVEGDWSNAAFWLAAGIEVTNLDNNSLQKDRQILTIKNQHEIDAAEIPDLVPILAVVAATKKSAVRIFNVKRLRLKESDRIQSTAKMIESLGGNVKIDDTEIIIYGAGILRGGIVDGSNDHRIVMSAAIASCFCEQTVTITGAQAVDKTYPNFFEDFNKMGGKSYVV